MAMVESGSRPNGGRSRSLRRALARRLRLVLGLIWASSPVIALWMVLLAIVAGLAPAAKAWLTRAIINDLVPRPGDARHTTSSGAHASGQAGQHALHAAQVGAGHLVVLAVLLGVVGLAGAIMPNAQRYIESQSKRELELLMRDRTYRAINSFPGLSRFESPVFHDKIRMILQVSQSAPTKLVSSGLTMVQSGISAVGFFATLYVINPFLAAIVLATSVPAMAAQFSMSRRRAGVEWRMTPRTRRELFYGFLLSDQRAAKEVRLFGLGGFLRNRMLDETRTVNREKRAVDLRAFRMEGSLELLSAVIAAGGLIWTIREAAAGRLSIGDVSMFTMSVVGAQMAVSGMVARFADVYEQLIQLGHYEDVISIGADLPLTELPAPVPPLRDGIEFRDVWFRYEPDHPWVLRGANLRIPYGRAVALIGLNGAGKSTLVKLLCRLYDPEHGSIHWDGVDIRHVDPAELRQRIGTVFQDYMAYDLTAAENIGMGDLDRLDDLELIRDSAGRAGMDGKLSGMAYGYDTMLSRMFTSNAEKDDPDAGVFLSGGEWQRVALARGLMRADRDLLILDEPSSGLDAEAEHEIHRRLTEIRHGRTSLLISHRLGSVRDADQICVLADGRVVEEGTHRQLMAMDGEYRRLFQMQASGYQDADGSNECDPGSVKESVRRKAREAVRAGAAPRAELE